MTTYKLWDNTPALINETPIIEFYPAENRKTDATVVIFPGGGYGGRAPKEGDGYAVFLNSIGISAFVCEYRVTPNLFPIPLLDARRAIRFVRHNSSEFGIDPSRVAVMGSSAGGHLAALVSTYTEGIDYENQDDIDNLSPIPDLTILCYPVIHFPDETNVAHKQSYINLAANKIEYSRISPDLLVNDTTPKAFLWHTSDDDCVNVINSYLYATALRQHSIQHEMHIFPHGHHGLDVAYGFPHVAQWTALLQKWLVEVGWFK